VTNLFLLLIKSDIETLLVNFSVHLLHSSTLKYLFISLLFIAIFQIYWNCHFVQISFFWAHYFYESYFEYFVR
jgi:hypothetical protein